MSKKKPVRKPAKAKAKAKPKPQPKSRPMTTLEMVAYQASCGRGGQMPSGASVSVNPAPGAPKGS